MNTYRNAALRVLLMLAAVGLWELCVRAFAVPVYVLPAPSSIVRAFYVGVSRLIYVQNAWITLEETLLGFAAGASLGFMLGTAIALSRRFEYFLYPSIVMFQALPKVALAPLIILWFGVGLPSKIVTAALIAFFPLMVNTVVGLRSADEDRVNLMRSLDASEAQIFWMLRLPSALPFLMAGLEVAMIFALIGAIVAEFVSATAGLGVLINSLNFSGDTAGIFSILLILAVMGLLLNSAIASVRRRVLFWDASQKSVTEGTRRGGTL
ncbi:MAG TPA: ABC transporter permease [Stellaceae bacterium]|nr:ABC transporter permease [Stellaceae bacterium]